MKKAKQKLLFIALLVSLSLAGIQLSSNAQDINIDAGLPEIPDAPEENLCRCKADGCYGGNLISFRPRCGQGSCRDFDQNCP